MKTPSGRHRRRRNPIAAALYLNAAVLGAILVTLLARDAGSASWNLTPAAFGQVQQPIAGGAGLFIMPAQFWEDIWGCYVMDVDTQTLTAYRYDPGRRALELVASRNFRYDRQLKDFNTFPPPLEVKAMVEKEQDVNRVLGSEPPPPLDPELTPAPD